jgi:putative transposase
MVSPPYPSGVDRLPDQEGFSEAERLIDVDGGGSVHEFIYGRQFDWSAAVPLVA